MNEIFLPILTFVLGILATIATQLISRQLKIVDARQKKKLEHLQRIREWMDSYNALFHCAYPDIPELCYAKGYIRTVQTRDSGVPVERFEYTDPKIAERVYKALLEFQSTLSAYQNAEKTGCESLLVLSEPNRKYAFEMFRSAAEDLYYPLYFENEFLFPRGLVKSLAPHLTVLREMSNKVFQDFPNLFTHTIIWGKLSSVDSKDVLSKVVVIKTLFSSDDELELYEEFDSIKARKGAAQGAITRILREIQKYEDKWVIPA